MATIGDCVEACQTWNPAVSGPETTFDYIDLSSVDRERKRIAGAEVVQGSNAPSRARQLVKKGDVLVSTVRPNLNGVAMVPVEFNGATASTGFTVLRAREDRIDPAYLFHWVRHPSFIQDMVSKAIGASYPAVSDRIIRESSIPLPSLSEQRRIAAILDKADALRSKRREAIAKLDQLLQSVFLDMFGDPVTNPRNWPVVQFGSVTESRLGKMLDEKTRIGEHMCHYLANVNVQWGQFELGNLRQMNFAPDDQQEFSLRYGDLLMCEGGEPGRCAIWKEQHPDCYYQKALHRIRCNPEQCMPEYVQWLFWFLAQAGAFRSSVAVATIAHLPGVKLKKLQVPLPPLALQQKFAQDAEKIEQQKSTLKRSADHLNTLFASLQHRAFTGTL